MNANIVDEHISSMRNTCRITFAPILVQHAFAICNMLLLNRKYVCIFLYLDMFMYIYIFKYTFKWSYSFWTKSSRKQKIYRKYIRSSNVQSMHLALKGTTRESHWYTMVIKVRWLMRTIEKIWTFMQQCQTISKLIKKTYLLNWWFKDVHLAKCALSKLIWKMRSKFVKKNTYTFSKQISVD